MKQNYKSVPVNFKFKGERDYIQGPDIINALLAHFTGEEIVNLKFSINGFIKKCTNTILVYSIEPKRLAAKCRGHLTYGGKKLWVEIIEQEQQLGNEGRYPYDESAITSQCVVKGEMVSLTECATFSFIEIVVAMKKFLLSELNRQINCKWVFTAIEIDYYEDIRSNLSIRIIHNFQNKLVKSEILSSGEHIGLIYFSSVSS